MKKSILKVALATSLAFIMPSVSNAQLGDLLKSAAGTAVEKTTGSSTLANVVTSLLGTSKVSEKSIVGTWTYQEPCIAAESSNILTQAAAAATVTKAQNELSKALTKAGIKAGTLKVTFADDGKATILLGKKKVSATYKLDGSDLLLTLTTIKKTIRMNCKISSGKLQLAMKADKLLTLVNTISSTAAAASTSLATLNSLLKNVDGLYVGLQFTK